jgi:hypothetical protein
MQQLNPLRCRAALVPMLCVVAVLILCFCAVAAAAAPKLRLAGSWSGSYSGAFAGTFKLEWTQTGSKLAGSITLSSPKGKYGINGSITGRTIKFGAVGVGATYKGSVSGTKMSGSFRSPQGGGTWSAHRCKPRTAC